MQTVIIPLRHMVQFLRKSFKKRAVMKNFALAGLTLLVFASSAVANGVTVSEETETCLECHATLHPGIVQEWMKSRHAKVTPAEGLKREKLKRRISVEQVPDKVANVSVGCAECHTMNAKKHKDTFEHADYQVHIVVTPEDCATCHSVEVAQYGKNVMSYARTNLVENPLYKSLMNEVNGIHGLEETMIRLEGHSVWKPRGLI